MFRSAIPVRATVAAALALSACATTPALHSQQALGGVARGCGLALGEVIQEADVPKLLFVYRLGLTQPQLTCVERWARPNRLRVVYISAAEFTP